MNADQLVHLFKYAVDDSETISRLRSFVLDLAVRGRLVEQDSTDEPSSELLPRIAAEKMRLAKMGLIRKQKDLPPVTSPPFAIPQNWTWTRIRQISSDRGQKIPKSKFTYIDVSAVSKERGSIVNPVVFEPHKAPSRARKVVDQGDVIYSCVRPYLLNIAIIEGCYIPEPIVSTAFAVLNGHGLVLSRYLWIVLRSPFMVSCVEVVQRGQAYPAINDTDFATLPFPLPPLGEQHRIVAKVDELMALCDRLEEAQKKRDESRNLLTKASFGRLNDSKTDDLTFHSISNFVINQFPVLTRKADQVKTLRQSILNLAIRGKLVAQDPAEGSALELLPQIALEKERMEKGRAIRKQKHLLSVTSPPFEIPSTWRWVKFGDIIKFSAGKTPPRKELRFWNTGDYSWVCIGDIPNGQTLLETKETVSEEARSIIFKSNPSQPGTIILSFKLTIGKIARLGVPAYFNEAIISICPIIEEIEPYLFTFLPLFARSGKSISAVKGETLNRNSISNIQVPLPPLAEQHRIVTKVDELMVLCDRLESNLEITSACRASLFESLVSNTLQQEKSTRDSANTIARGFTV